MATVVTLRTCFFIIFAPVMDSIVYARFTVLGPFCAFL